MQKRAWKKIRYNLKVLMRLKIIDGRKWNTISPGQNGSLEGQADYEVKSNPTLTGFRSTYDLV